MVLRRTLLREADPDPSHPAYAEGAAAAKRGAGPFSYYPDYSVASSSYFEGWCDARSADLAPARLVFSAKSRRPERR